MRNRSNPCSSPGRWVGIVCLGLALAGCTDVLGPEDDPLTAARARWSAADADAYVFEFRRSCFCVPDFIRQVRIEVLAGTVNSAVYLDTGDAVPPPLDSVPTIEDLFDEIRAAIDGNAFSVVADYDDNLGYPRSVAIDFIENAIDDEMAFDVSSFQLLDTSAD